MSSCTWRALGALLVFIPGLASALDLGFEAIATVSGSDNINALNRDQDVEAGSLVFGQVGVFGEQRGRIVRGAFSGELETRRQLEPSDDSFDTVTRFLGAANIRLGRGLDWYVGDVFGGVREGDALQPLDDFNLRRRNVFVTGPNYAVDIDADNRTEARLLYVNQTEEDEPLESLINASASWQRDIGSGATAGLRVSDIYTDEPNDSDAADFNRLSVVAFWNRTRRLNEVFADIGATRYSSEDESFTGIRGQLGFNRRLTQQARVYATLFRDLRDDTVNTIGSLIGTSTANRPGAEGIFDETRIELGYAFQTSRQTFEVGVGSSTSDYRLLTGIGGGATADEDAEDQSQLFGFVSYARSLSSRLRASASLRAERQDFDNRQDENDSVVSEFELGYQISRSFELEAAARLYKAEGARTRDARIEDIDVVENRVSLRLRWAPPSRASKDLIVELKTLVQ